MGNAVAVAMSRGFSGNLDRPASAELSRSTARRPLSWLGASHQRDHGISLLPTSGDEVLCTFRPCSWPAPRCWPSCPRNSNRAPRSTSNRRSTRPVSRRMAPSIARPPQKWGLRRNCDFATSVLAAATGTSYREWLTRCPNDTPIAGTMTFTTDMERSPSSTGSTESGSNNRSSSSNGRTAPATW